MFCLIDTSPTHNSFQEFLKDNALFLALGVVGIILVAVSIILLLSFSKNKNAKENDKQEVFSAYDLLGGKDNVISKSITGSRVSLVLKDYNIINEDELKNNGVASIIKMSNKITLVFKGDSESFFKRLD